MQWDPEQYLRFGDHRARPFHDLLARVEADDPSYVVDLGCGPGPLTELLARRWPHATVVGVDSSPEMIARAERLATDGLEFVRADLRDWTPEYPVDVLVSNATLQWVPDHLAQLPRLAAMLAPRGWLALQRPGNFDAPSHTELAAMRTSPRWRDRLAGLAERAAVHEPATYLATLAAAGLVVDAWETTYLQVLAGEDAVLEWMKGTGLRPTLELLTEPEAAEFVAEYGERLRAAYPAQPFGTVLPFRRIFMVARRGV
ncbi:MAG TPA: trans-aconitate 2-methyltransferase [Actinomycetes bacterium]|nr:trans-aconitate 2-methyltransferase [Actinomycetes bacterium]